MSKHTIGVIGGGAAGMMAAIAAAERGAHVTLLESKDRVGKKILSTGNGKCNLGNLELNADCYHGAAKDWLEECLAQFGTDDTIRFFGGIGLLVKERNGYLYPVSEQASVVLDVLRVRLKLLRVHVITGHKVEEITRKKDHFIVTVGKESFTFEKLILACGGKAAPKTGSDGSGFKLAHLLGHEITPIVPALVQLRCREKFLNSVAGVRADARIRVLGDTLGREIVERGELQLTDYGISGIPVFQMSRHINYLLEEGGEDAEVEVSIDFFPDYSQSDFEKFIAKRKAILVDRTVDDFFLGMLHKKLMHLFIKQVGLSPEQPVRVAGEGKLIAVFLMCRDFRLHVCGSNSFGDAQVCAGGVDTEQVGTNMESKLVPGLYFAGEILNVDGRCGGYNLQWAWTSGYLAGRSASETTR